MKRYGLWKYLLILLVLCFGVIYSLPNLYAPDPAVQISYTSSSQTADTFLADKVKELIEKQNLEAKIELEKDYVLVRTNSYIAPNSPTMCIERPPRKPQYLQVSARFGYDRVYLRRFMLRGFPKIRRATH